MKILSALLFCSGLAYSQIRLPRLISDGMILQRDSKIKVWGWSAPNEKVSLSFLNKEFATTANSNGEWLINLPRQQGGGPFEMIFTASNKITVKNILFGDVWLCSGQSNMELAMDRVRDKYPDVVANANNAEVRQFLVPDKYNFEKPQSDFESGEWLSVNKENIFRFSAVGYFFAAELYAKYKVPIGLINSALGGSPAQAWISEDAIKKFSESYNELQQFKDKNIIEQIESSDRKISHEWFDLLNRTDAGLKGHWALPDLDDHDWQEMEIPGYWADGNLGNVNGAVWFRKEVEIPKSMAGKPARLLLGRIVDADSVFVNGIYSGTTSYLYPPRKYSIKTDVLSEGRNVIAIRVINSSGKGGFVLDKPYALVIGSDTISLKGKWKLKLGASMNPLPGSTTIRWKPVGLYNSMIAPLLNYPIKGALWYQGESNTKNPGEYFELMRTLITDWREKWGIGDFPFLVVQLANFMEPKKEPSESNWAELRQAQLQTLSVSNTGLAVAIDLGEWNDVHPVNKKEVGRRLSLLAMQHAYGEKRIVSSGPLFKSVTKKGNQFVIAFSNSENGLTTSDRKELRYFAIAGSDGKFAWARAKMEGNKVIVWSDLIKDPVVVRYDWADNPDGNLCNKELLPASPFEARLSTQK